MLSGGVCGGVVVVVVVCVCVGGGLEDGYIGGHDARNAARSSLAADPAWGEYLAKVRPCAAEQSSLIFVEAPIVAEVSAPPCSTPYPILPPTPPAPGPLLASAHS